MTRSLMAAAVAAAFAAPAFADDPKPGTKPAQSPPKMHRLIPEAVKNDSWGVTVTVNSPTKSYAVGEEVVITVKSDQDGYLYLFNRDSAGQFLCLLPNKVQTKNQVKAGQTVTVPDPTDTFRLQTTEPAGSELLIAVITKSPSPGLDPAMFTRGGPTPITGPKFRSIMITAMGGDPKKVMDPPAAQSSGTAAQAPTQTDFGEQMQKDKQKVQQDNPAQFSKKVQEFATGLLEFTVTPGKVKGDPSQTPQQQSPPPAKPEQKPQPLSEKPPPAR